jgi:hypothetical protein
MTGLRKALGLRGPSHYFSKGPEIRKTVNQRPEVDGASAICVVLWQFWKSDCLPCDPVGSKTDAVTWRKHARPSRLEKQSSASASRQLIAIFASSHEHGGMSRCA